MTFLVGLIAIILIIGLFYFLNLHDIDFFELVISLMFCGVILAIVIRIIVGIGRMILEVF